MLDKFNFERKPAGAKFILENLKEIDYNPNPAPGVGGDAHRTQVDRKIVDMRKKLDL